MMQTEEKVKTTTTGGRKRDFYKRFCLRQLHRAQHILPRGDDPVGLVNIMEHR